MIFSTIYDIYGPFISIFQKKKNEHRPPLNCSRFGSEFGVCFKFAENILCSHRKLYPRIFKEQIRIFCISKKFKSRLYSFEILICISFLLSSSLIIEFKTFFLPQLWTIRSCFYGLWSHCRSV